MRKAGSIIVILICLFFLYIIMIYPTVKGHVDDGFRSYVNNIPIRGKDEGFMKGIDSPQFAGDVGKRTENFDGVWSFFPLKAEIQDLRIQGPFAMFNDHIFFEPDLAMEYVKFNAYKMMAKGEAEVIEIGHVDLRAKTEYITLMKMLGERNPNFKPKNMYRTPDGEIELNGYLNEVSSTVYLFGNLKVNVDGELEMEVREIIDYTNKPVRADASKNKVLGAIDLKWQFRMLNIDMELDRAAVSSEGIYIEAESTGWKKPDEKSTDENAKEGKSMESS